jgi:hypothetical protein
MKISDQGTASISRRPFVDEILQKATLKGLCQAFEPFDAFKH